MKNKNGELLNYSDCLKETAKFLKKGEIIAIKGLGGFNLSCDAKNEKSIRLLRERKQRPSKPLAVMMKDIETVRKYFYDHAFYGNQKTKITLATLGNDAGIYGAAKQVL